MAVSGDHAGYRLAYNAGLQAVDEQASTLRETRDRAGSAIREVGADEAGPVLKRYVAVATKTRAQFAASMDSPVADFAAEAERHPVFELVSLPADAATGGTTSADP